MTKKKMLVIDDEVAILLAFKRLFAAPDIEIETASTYESAVECIDNTIYDVVIADMRLTGVLGEEGLQLLRRIKVKNQDTHVIIITGYGSADTMTKAYELGASYYFEKPVSTKTIKQALGQLGIISPCMM